MKNILVILSFFIGTMAIGQQIIVESTAVIYECPAQVQLTGSLTTRTSSPWVANPNNFGFWIPFSNITIGNRNSANQFVQCNYLTSITGLGASIKKNTGLVICNVRGATATCN
jgi:hypothetical protein